MRRVLVALSSEAIYTLGTFGLSFLFGQLCGLDSRHLGAADFKRELAEIQASLDQSHPTNALAYRRVHGLYRNGRR